MTKAWFNSVEELPDKMIPFVDDDGGILGYLPERDCKKQNIPIFTIENEKRFLDDSYVLNTAFVAYERGLLNQGQDINEIQEVLLKSVIINKRKKDEDLQERTFTENMFVNNQALYKSYMEFKKQKEDSKEFEEYGDEEFIEQRVPGSMQELMDILKEFNEEGEEEEPEEDHEEEWASMGVLPPSTIEGMSD